ncbi:MAG TPA: YceI family protein [Dokdonella sp.]|nr:YceI family protein [Dokdonella sp.]
MSRTAIRHTLLSAALFATSAASAAPASYALDPAHTFPSFEADHMGISYWRGKLTSSSGTVVLDREAKTGTIEVAIDLASIDFGFDKLDAWARGKEFFDVAKYPKATYTGRLAHFVDGRPTEAVGTLDLHGVRKPLSLAIGRFKCIAHPIYKRELCGADASGSFDRAAFGLDAGKDYGFDMTVALRIQVEALRDE